MITKKDIIVYIPTYNDFIAFERAWTSCDELGLKVMVGDGRFKYPDREFPRINEADCSTDELAFFCEQHPVIDYFYHEPAPEQEKLNFAMDRAYKQGYKVFLMIGADAFLTGDLDEFVLNLDREITKLDIDEPVIMKIPFKEHYPTAKWNFSGHIAKQPRIFYNYHNMEVRNLHWLTYKKGEKDDTKYLNPSEILVDGLVLHHDNSVRPKERDILMTLYQDVNVLEERRIYYESCAPRWFENIVMQSYNTDNASYETIREDFLKMAINTHLILYDTKHDFTMQNRIEIEKIIQKKNNEFEHIPILTSVVDLGDNKYVVREGVSSEKLPTEALKKMYSGNEYDENKTLFAVPWIPGNIIVMERSVVHDIENFGEPEDFVKFCNGLGHMIYVDTDLRVKK